MIQVLKRIANTSVNTFLLAIMSIRPLFKEIWTVNTIWRTNDVPRQERVKVYEMAQACYCCWFNWRNSITCTHCNVISLEHDSIPQQAKSQRIDVDTTTYENYLRSSKSLQVSLNWIEKFGCQKPTKYGQFMFYEAVKNDMANSKETSFNNTISSTLSFITVLLKIYLKPSTYKRY